MADYQRSGGLLSRAFESPDRRRARRLKTFLVGTVRSSGLVIRVHVLNLSATGALCHSDEQPMVGSAVMLGFADLNLFARVSWVRGSRFGLRFNLPIELEVIRLAIDGELRSS